MLLIGGFLAAALLCLGIVRYRAGTTDTVLVQSVAGKMPALPDGEKVIRVSLAENQRFSVDGPLGRTEIEIRDGRVRVVNSPCSKKICVQTGWIDRPYQTIICVPNRVVVRLLASDDSNEIDGITE
jgi:hypothetical protein